MGIGAIGGFDPGFEPASKQPKGRQSGEKGRETPDSALFHRRQRAEQVPSRTPKQDRHANSRCPADAKAAHARFSFESGVHRFAAAANRVVLAEGIRGLLGPARGQPVFGGSMLDHVFTTDLLDRTLVSARTGRAM